MQASLSSGVVDVCLIPEVPFQLEGPHGLLAFLKQVIEVQGHAVVAVAEGAGQDLLYPGEGRGLEGFGEGRGKTAVA